MATILVSMFPERGHLSPTFRLARLLAARGHRVVYSIPADLAPLVEPQGFETVAALATALPRGSLGAQMRHLNFFTALDHLARAVESGECDRLLERVAPDLVLADVYDLPTSLAAYRAGVPVVTLNTQIPSCFDPAVAPPTTARLPARTRFGRLMTRLSWRRRLAAAEIVARLNFGARHDWLPRLARECRYPLEQIDRRWLPLPRLRSLPQLVLCPEPFDFARSTPVEWRYVEASVDLARTDPTDLDLDQDPRPLVYASLGTNSHRYLGRARFLRVLVGAFARLPDRRLLLALGGGLDRRRLGPVPGNVTLVDRAPQIEVLRRASLMITHGGLGSVKECIMMGVPMLVAPFAYDQPGNAARVVRRGVGVVANPHLLSVAKARSLIAGAHEDVGLRARMTSLSRVFNDWEAAAPGVARIERALAAPWASREGAGARQPVVAAGAARPVR